VTHVLGVVHHRSPCGPGCCCVCCCMAATRSTWPAFLLRMDVMSSVYHPTQLHHLVPGKHLRTCPRSCAMAPTHLVGCCSICTLACVPRRLHSNTGMVDWHLKGPLFAWVEPFMSSGEAYTHMCRAAGVAWATWARWYGIRACVCWVCRYELWQGTGPLSPCPVAVAGGIQCSVQAAVGSRWPLGHGRHVPGGSVALLAVRRDICLVLQSHLVAVPWHSLCHRPGSSEAQDCWCRGC